MDPYKKVTMTRREIIINNLIGGIFWGLGSTIGVAIVLTLVGFILHFLNIIPFIGNFVTKISQYVAQHR